MSGKYLDGIATIKERLILILNIEQVIDVSGLDEMATELPYLKGEKNESNGSTSDKSQSGCRY